MAGTVSGSPVQSLQCDSMKVMQPTKMTTPDTAQTPASPSTTWVALSPGYVEGLRSRVVLGSGCAVGEGLPPMQQVCCSTAVGLQVAWPASVSLDRSWTPREP
mmetsp:Transcript_4017/g.8881  ORF Transcript_4017/g.8881 Transcript_4017/m.8881 type:complete len:103 (-) Transcript_4017:206-514(-)